ncbi:hypothetical protein CONCODRAFT_80748 [Conidiobolus coronatus NRRL 28638]|uniref:F-box domain-containing protein n=1 Tax=Conidiobolus coronatus (strain ATCC 28846 / CBS 209.66 / NRRL 28638) TaxID=796925 RepID=A0A137NS56_CONC2|nr:hypothetical protein CONCODRAFT_80748 [Conidiobolus coronatus NRRL 28638]|eukprot:KXN65520.1 hypothetical protein CONCODRAFT_80748 [Conidiobolus coronatus NRRL 28638]
MFSELKVNSNVLLSHSNYFNNYNYYQLNNFTYLERFKIFRKYGFNRELEYKEVLIDPFIEEAVNTLSLASSVYCKVLELCALEREGYFLFPIFCNYLNLKIFRILISDIPYTKFFNLLTKLESLQELDISNVNLILSPTEAPISPHYLQFPKSLTKLTYQFIKFGVTDLPEARPLEFVRNIKRGYSKQNLNLLPQHLPNLKSLEVYNDNWNDTEFEKFLNMCPALEYVYRPNSN